MTRPRIYLTRNIPDPGIEILRNTGDLTIDEMNEETGPDRQRVLAGVREADVLVSLLTEPIDGEVMDANPNLLGIAQYAVGFNNIDVDAATERGLPVSNTPGVLSDTTADFAWTLLMASARMIPQGHNYTVANRYKIWGPNLLLGADISPGGSGEPKTLGIAGYGRIGRAVRKRASGFDMKIIAFDPYAPDSVFEEDGVERAETLDPLLEASDFISIHVLLNEETRHLFSTEEFSKMKSSAIIINTSRGPVIDEAALVTALKEGQIGGAGLDVYENEPAMAEGLTELDNVVLAPHIASATRDTRGKMASMAAENAVAHLEKRPAPNCVNPEVYETEAYQKRVKGS
ncbi:MAG: D-glycerate dehydrogenase [Planctomycetota bacterium]|jgi:lactate dehydrogenase-like 2-hydroxyacid dehydrogenase|nr:D-glycerate dehydrogenase [Planctomycetota bacterium]